MAFAMFYNRQDVSQIVAEISRSDISAADKSCALKLWNGGLKNWSTTAPAPANSPYFGEGIPANPTLMFVVGGSGVTRQLTVEWLRRLSVGSASAYLEAIAEDMLITAVEPWPPA